LPSFFLESVFTLFAMMCRYAGVFAFVGVHLCVPAQTIYRCGNAYTNQPTEGANCKPLSGGPVTVIEGLRVNPSANGAALPASGAKVDKAEQQQRDVQAVAVLQAELQRVQAHHAELLREWNQGEPERLPDERRQPQKYQARVQSLKASIQRSEADIAGLQRELARLNATSGK
jgi:uncharacterized small protein (DUF1192 family)